ncbi:MAG: Rrf2 family transcriptional regulator [Deltaproteobacteria bacterium]|nr:Rrf2 family transcriptional regulator [Deltaproteobacteria bacterium]
MISLTSKDALRALLSVARLDAQTYVTVVELAEISGVPKPYLSKLIKQLVKSGYLEGRKGPGGGVRLSAEGRKATFYDICLVTNEPITREHCFLSRTTCRKNTPCAFHAHWKEISGAAINFLKRSRIINGGAI